MHVLYVWITLKYMCQGVVSPNLVNKYRSTYIHVNCKLKQVEGNPKQVVCT